MSSISYSHSYNRKSKQFLRWLSKNQYTIHDASLFNEFAGIFKSDLIVETTGYFITKPILGPFVLQFVEEPLIRGYDAWHEAGIKLVNFGIVYVIIHDMHTLKPNDIPSALLIKVDRLQDKTDTFVGKERTRKFYFEDVLWQRHLEIDPTLAVRTDVRRTT